MPLLSLTAFTQVCRSATVPVLALLSTVVGLLALSAAAPATGSTAAATADPTAAVGAVPADPRRALPILYRHHREVAQRAADEREGEQAATLRALADPGRQLLTLDPSGRGLLTEVFGDLASAPTAAVLVGGVGTELATFDAGTLRRSALALSRRVPQAAVIAWADYVSPAGIGLSAGASEMAEAGGRRLRTFLDGLHAQLPAQRVTLVCHSYGSPVCAAALADGRARGVRDVVDLASPGVGEGELPAGVHRWTATGSDDPIRLVPHVRLGGLGLGRDPAGTAGARRLPVPAHCDHDDYLTPTSPTLRALAELVRT